MLISRRVMVTKRILLVDQEPQITLLVRQTLEKTGKYSVRAEHTGELALEAARSFRPDLILVDLIAEGADGGFFTGEFHADAFLQDTPVVRLSSLRSGDAVDSNGTLDGYSFSIAPVRIEELVRGVEELFLEQTQSVDR
jgi:PleD family two-component response regulator